METYVLMKKKYPKEIKYETISAQNGYNKNITEQMYIDEMEVFLKAANNEIVFHPH